MIRTVFTSLFGAFLLAHSFIAQAVMVGDVDVPDVLARTSDTPELKLNGASMRVLYGVVDTYVGQLYLEEKSTDPETILHSDQYKRMVFQSVMKKVSGRRMATALYEAINLNTTTEEGAALEERLQEVIRMFDRRMKKGESGFIDWIPERQASRIVINGEIRGYVKGKDLNTAILRIWVGENPVSHTFKQHILGLEVYKSPHKKKKRGKRR